MGVLCVRLTIFQVKLAGFVSGLGAATADAIFGFIAAFGLTFISDWLIGYQQWLRIAGGCYLLYVGGSALLARPETKSNSERDTETPLRDFASTFALTLTNPITILAFLGIFSVLGLGGEEATFGRAAILVSGCGAARCCGGSRSASGSDWFSAPSSRVTWCGSIAPRGPSSYCLERRCWLPP